LGRVDGRIDLQRTLVVAPSGIVKAEVKVKNAIVSGVVVGNIHASESIEITREGRMVGDIYAPASSSSMARASAVASTWATSPTCRYASLSSIGLDPLHRRGLPWP